MDIIQIIIHLQKVIEELYSCFKKVISLNPSSPYAIKAREEISKEFGDFKLDEVDLDLLLF